MPKKRILPHEASKILNVAKKSLYLWADRGVINCKREGPLDIRTFDRKELIAFAKTLPKKRSRGFKLGAVPLKKKKR